MKVLIMENDSGERSNQVQDCENNRKKKNSYSCPSRKTHK